MNRLLGIAVFLFLHVITVTAQDSLSSLEAHMKSQGDLLTQLKNFKKSTAGDNYDVVYHRIHWTIDPYTDTLYGEVTTFFRTKESNFGSVAFDMMDYLQADSVRYHGNDVFNEHSANVLRIDLPTFLSNDILDSVTVYYSGDPTQNTGGYYVREKRRPKNDHPVVWSLSEPYGAMTWWPCKQTLSDKIDSLDVFVTVPKGDRAASNGILTDSTEESGMVTYHWKHRYPITTYLVAVAVTNYSEFSDWVRYDNGDSLQVLNYLYPESVPSMREPAKATVDMIHVYDSLFGTYPFKKEKYGHAQFGRSGGMEHQTMSFMSDLNFGLVAHELAHQWFGDATTCRTWTDLWLNEGFATFLTLISYETLQDRQTYRNAAKQTVDNVLKQTDGSVYVTDTLNRQRLFSGRLTYNKGAMLLQMLRFRLGDSIFYEATRQYLNAPEHKYGFARTSDLIYYLETVSGTDLTDFFSQWYYNQGYPNVDITWRKNGAMYEVRARQIPSHPSVEFFDVDLPLVFKNGSRDTMVVIRPNTDDFTTVVFLPFEPDSLIFDPDYRILAKASVLKTDDIRSQMTVYPNPTVNTLNIRSVPFPIDHIVIYDMNGREVVNLPSPISGQADMEIQVGFLRPGIYTVLCHGESNSVSSRFMKR